MIEPYIEDVDSMAYLIIAKDSLSEFCITPLDQKASITWPINLNFI